MSITKPARIGVSLLAIAAMSVHVGCGVYSFSQRGASTIKSIAISPFENSTPELELSDRITVAVTDAFLAEGSLKVLPAELAETNLQASLTSYQRLPYQFDQSDQVIQYRVVIGFRITLIRTSDAAEIWSEQTTQEGIYDALTETEDDGRSRAASRLVEVILNKTTKSW